MCKFPILVSFKDVNLISQGMEHHSGLADNDQDAQDYMKRDLVKRSKPAFKIIRDEIVGR